MEDDMKISGRIFQLEPDAGTAFLNVMEDHGMIAVWGSRYQTHTILVQDWNEFYLMQFSNGDFYEEWMEENKDRYFKITFLTEVGKCSRK